MGGDQSVTSAMPPPRGSILGSLSREKQERFGALLAVNGMRHSRFGGVYQIRSSCGDGGDGVSDPGHATVMMCRGVPGVDGMAATLLPQAAKKRSRRNSTCTKVIPPLSLRCNVTLEPKYIGLRDRRQPFETVISVTSV